MSLALYGAAARTPRGALRAAAITSLPPPLPDPPAPPAPTCRCIIAVGWTDIMYKFQDAFHWILFVYFAMVMAARHGREPPSTHRPPSLGSATWASPLLGGGRARPLHRLSSTCAWSLSVAWPSTGEAQPLHSWPS